MCFILLLVEGSNSYAYFRKELSTYSTDRLCWRICIAMSFRRAGSWWGSREGNAGREPGLHCARRGWAEAWVAARGLRGGAGDAVPGEPGAGDEQQGGAAESGVPGANAGADGGGPRNLSAGGRGNSRAHQPRGTGRDCREGKTLADVRRDSHGVWQLADCGGGGFRAG